SSSTNRLIHRNYPRLIGSSTPLILHQNQLLINSSHFTLNWKIDPTTGLFFSTTSLPFPSLLQKSFVLNFNQSIALESHYPATDICFALLAPNVADHQ